MTASAHTQLRALAARLDDTLALETDLAARLAAIAGALPQGVKFSTSLGMEDQAVLHAIATSDETQAIETFMLDTGRHFPETLDLVATSEMSFGRRIAVIAPEREMTEQLVARDGVLGFRLSVEARKACCHVRKVAPLQRALKGASGWITGLRRGQSSGRAEVPFAQWDEAFALIKFNPIADWSLETLDAYLAHYAIPVSPLHAQGFPSIGCQPCTRAIRAGEDIRAGRWWWEQQDGKECGLHNAPHRRQQAAAAAKETIA